MDRSYLSFIFATDVNPLQINPMRFAREADEFSQIERRGCASHTDQGEIAKKAEKKIIKSK